MGEYKIQKGDSWWKIANANGMTVDKLKMLNPGIKMHPGQTLQLNKVVYPPTQQSSLQSTTSEKPGFFTIMGNKVSSWWNGTSNSNKPTINVDAEIEEILKLPKNQRKEVLREIMKKLGKESLGKWGDDGNFGNMSKAAYRKFREKGYSYDFSKKSEEKSLLVSKSKNKNYWDQVKNDPEFIQYLYTSGGSGNRRKIQNLINVLGNYAYGLINPDGKTPLSLGDGAERQMVAAALYNKLNPKTSNDGINDSAHYALGGLGDTNKHSGTEFREKVNDTSEELPKWKKYGKLIETFSKKAMHAPYHYIYGLSSDARFDKNGFHSLGDNYTFNNVWDGTNVIKVLEDGEGNASFNESLNILINGIRKGDNPLAVMETAASQRGVNTQRHKDVEHINQTILNKWAREYLNTKI